MAQIPYEFLVRWNHLTGELQGAHCKTFDSVTGREGDAQSVAIAGAVGFPLSDILTAIETGAIIAADNAVAALNAANAAHAATVAVKDAEIATLTAEIVALTSKP